MPLTLPPLPRSFGAIRHVFASSLAAVEGKKNALALRNQRKIFVVLVDGLGADQLRERSGHAPFISSQLNAKSIAHSAFPATTSANIGSFATGLLPGSHGLIGHQVWDRQHDERLNLLVGWNERTNPLEWQPHQTVPERALESGIACYNIANDEYRNTPYTLATMRGALFVPGEKISDRFARAREIVAKQERSLSYLYIPELDKFGHKHGWRSAGWAALLEDVDAAVRNFVSKLPKDAGLILTSDHGMMETTKERQLVLDAQLDGVGLEFFGGDTRASYLYLNDLEAIPLVLSRLEPLNHALQPVATSDLVHAGWYGDVGSQASARLPEVVLLARSNFTLYHSKFSKQRAFDMVSHHGSISDAELRIPLIRFGV